jgi:hypothetical protein
MNQIKRARSALGEKSYQTRKRKRHIAHAGSQKNAERIIRLEPGIEFCILVSGQFSFLNVLEALLNQIDGPARVDLSSWTVAKFEYTRLAQHLATGKISRLRFLTDSSLASRQPKEYENLMATLGAKNVRVMSCHAKISLIHNEQWNLAVRTSANMNQNRRIEYYEISDDPALLAYMLAFFDEVFTHPPAKIIGRRKMRDLKTVGETLPYAEPDMEIADPIDNLNKIIEQLRLDE